MEPTTPAQGRTVLVVDDDPDVRRVLVDAFEAEGFRVATAANGMQALHRLRDAAPDAIVLDLSMPLMSGDAFLYAWRAGAEMHAVPVVAISAAYPTLQPGDLGVDAFFPKPFDVDLLARHVTDLLAYRPRGAEAAGRGGRGAELDAALKDLAKVMGAILGGAEALAKDPTAPPHLRAVATSTLGSAQRAGVLVRHVRHLASLEGRKT